MSKITQTIAGILRSSILWGGLASFGFYTLIHTGVIDGPFFQRYFAAHWTLYTETTLFFIGVAELLLKAFDLSDQRARLKAPLLPAPAEAPVPVAEASKLLETLDALPASQRSNYLPRRLHEALEGIVRQASAEKLEDDLKYLSEVDASRAHSGYALMRIIIWAIPILGFLGTVIGITIAIASLNPQALESSLGEVTGGLGIAFDTTALALTLSMTLMFGQFLVDRFEQRLLGDVDAKTFEALTGRFESSGTSRDPQLAAMQRMSELVMLRTEGLVQKQVELWQTALDAAQQRWSEVMASSGTLLEESLAKALTRHVKEHADRLVAAEDAAAQLNRRQWMRLHKALRTNVEQSTAQQGELSRQTDMLLRISDASSHVTKLEKSLNSNLSALAGAQHFQEMMLNLSATLTLLNARLGQVTPLAPHIDLHSGLLRDGKDKPAGKVA
ncbi:MAG TPA: MotA/TolQ/ExbB proton channel family protein [Pirellulales bacterium]|nr:MotA/TolQ/ExbB proton channel family protein [Pirellulales bacterium]